MRHARTLGRSAAPALVLLALLSTGCGGTDAPDDELGAQHPGHQEGMTHSPDMDHGSQTGQATEPGQAGFGALQEIVGLLQADPETDWSTVNITALRDHLVDMDALFLRTSVSQVSTATGFEATVTGDEGALAAAQRMVPAHVDSLAHRTGWTFNVTTHGDAVVMVASGAMDEYAAKLKALGFFGVMATDSHHQAHHVMIATGQAMH
jgi:hypothetical protein